MSSLKEYLILLESMKIAVGDTVRLKPALDKEAKKWCPEGRKNNRTAVVKARLSDIKGGIYLADDLRGIKYWNEVDLELVSKAKE